MKFTVVIEDWDRGHSESELLTGDGKRCCIGFAGSQCGVPDDEMLGIGCIDNVANPQKAEALVYRNKDDDEFIEYDWVWSAYAINDDDDIDDEERMRKLQVLASANGHEFEFVHKGE